MTGRWSSYILAPTTRGGAGRWSGWPPPAASWPASGHGWPWSARAEQPLAGRLLDRLDGDAADLAGRLGLGGLAGLHEQATLLVGNDSGPRHLAAAVGTATVAVHWGVSLGSYGPLYRPGTGHLPITRRMLGVDPDGSRTIWTAHVGCLVGPDGSRRIVWRSTG